MLIEETLQGFLDEVASDSPAPGGGSVSALSGAMGAALGAMVCRLTIGKKGYEAVKDQMSKYMGDLDDQKKALTLLIDMDTDAFNKLMNAFKLAKSTDDEKAVRSRAIQEATKEAIKVPLETCRKCLKVAELCDPIAQKGNTNSITDVGCAALMARAGLEGAAMNVRINLGSLKDEEFKSKVQSELVHMEKMMAEVSKKVLDTVKSKMQ
jgi:formiminotetrahydrofolate cyclodeaminase